MNTPAENVQQHKSQSAAGSTPQKQMGGESVLQLTDNRPAASRLRTLHDFADNRPHTKQLKAIQGIMNDSQAIKRPVVFQQMAGKYASGHNAPIQKRENRTNLPDKLKTGIENLSGHAMDDVKVHYNSERPAQLQAHAFAQGTNIHIAPGKEKHLPHEAWHVVQQKQGRVRPTLQMKSDVTVNDDAALEKEADMMGEKASSAVKPLIQYKISPGISLQANGPVQRKITITGSTLSLDEIKREHLKDFDNPYVNDGILPAWEAMDRTFESVEALRTALKKVSTIYIGLARIDSYKALSEYIQAQRFAQTFIMENQEDFRGLITTAGFEHEFMQMKSGPLQGVSHLVLASSGESTMPMTGLPFFLETDASNALELVFPPLLVPTVNGSTLPWPRQIKEIDTLIKNGLSGLISALHKEANKDVGWFGDTKNATMQMLITGLTGVLGVPMTATPNLTVKRENMTHNTKFEALGNANITAEAFNAIQVGASSKHKGGIDSQVNIAMDMHAAKLLDEPREFESDISGATGTLKSISEQVDTLLPTPKQASPALVRFYEIMRVKMGSMVAVESQHLVAQFQQAQLERIGEPIPDFGHLSDEERRKWTAYQERESNIGKDALLSSIVKDTRSIWIKDHLTSVLDGMLDEDDKRLLTANLLDRRHIAVPRLGKFDGFNTALREAVQNLLAHLLHTGSKEATSKKDKTEGHPGVGFMEHNPAFIGARQDTYIPSDKVQLPEIWGSKKLHVVELRKSNLDLLDAAYEKLTGKGLPKSPEVIVKDPEKYKPDHLGEAQWQIFVGLMQAIDVGQIDHRDLPPLHIGTDAKTEKEIDLKKGLLKKPETDSKEPELPESKSKTEDSGADAVSSPSVSTAEKTGKESEPGKKKPEPVDQKKIMVKPNAGGGDCLFYALAGRDLPGIDLITARREVAAVRRMVPEDQGSNANQVAMALYQSGVPVQVVRELTLGRHNVPNAVYAALQEIPGMYAGEEELIQWCRHHGRAVAVVYQDGTVARFDGEGRHPVAIDPANRYTATLAALQAAHLSIYKTPNHWERITKYNGSDVPQ